jgi:hypothetical protein
VTVKVGVGTGSQSQSKYATKSIVQADGEGVGVGQTPEVKKFPLMSGQFELQGDEPLSTHEPPKEVLKHQ